MTENEIEQTIQLNEYLLRKRGKVKKIRMIWCIRNRSINFHIVSSMFMSISYYFCCCLLIYSIWKQTKARQKRNLFAYDGNEARHMVESSLDTNIKNNVNCINRVEWRGRIKCKMQTNSVCLCALRLISNISINLVV